MLVIQFSILGDDVLVRGLSRFEDVCQDFTPVWPQIHEDFVGIETTQFGSQGARGGRTWEPLTLKYAKWKDRYFPGRPILELTGELKLAMTHGLMVTMEPMELTMAPMVQKAWYHQHGTVKMVIRPVVELTEADKMRWVRMIQRYLVEQSQGVTQ